VLVLAPRTLPNCQRHVLVACYSLQSHLSPTLRRIEDNTVHTCRCPYSALSLPTYTAISADLSASDNGTYVNFVGQRVRSTSSAQVLPAPALRRTWGPWRGKGTFLRAHASGGECSPHSFRARVGRPLRLSNFHDVVNFLAILSGTTAGTLSDTTARIPHHTCIPRPFPTTAHPWCMTSVCRAFRSS